MFTAIVVANTGAARQPPRSPQPRGNRGNQQTGVHQEKQ